MPLQETVRNGAHAPIETAARAKGLPYTRLQIELREGSDVSIVACGVEIDEALKAAELLAAEGISAEVIDAFCVKPLDEDTILASVEKTGCIVTAEEHSVIGGLGGAVSEVVCETIPVPVVKVGVEDVFGRSGPAVELLHIYGLDAENIVKKAKQALELKAAR